MIDLTEAHQQNLRRWKSRDKLWSLLKDSSDQALWQESVLPAAASAAAEAYLTEAHQEILRYLPEHIHVHNATGVMVAQDALSLVVS